MRLSTRNARLGLPAALALVFVCALAMAGAAVRAEAPALPVIEPVALAAPPLVPVAAAASRTAQEPGVDVIEELDFDDGIFPPAGWQTYQQGIDDPEQETYVWGLQDCDLPSLPGNVYAAWTSGGGRLGAELLCGQAYEEPVNSWLLRDPIDATDYAGGLRIHMRVKLDMPEWADTGDPAQPPPPFRVCTTRNEDGDLRCRQITGPEGWLTTGDSPPVFEWSAGLPEVRVLLVYVDQEPSGEHVGVYVDELKIEGLGEAGAETPTPGSPTAVVPTNTPRPGEPTPAPPTSEPDQPTIYLPRLARNDDQEPGPVPTAMPGAAAVIFGTRVDGTGQVEDPGYVFGEIDRLCAKESWMDLPVGTDFGWRWFQQDPVSGDFVRIDSPDLDKTIQAEESQGFASQCIQYGDPDTGAPVPVPDGVYRVSVFLRGEDVPSVTRDARVLGGEGPTPAPTGVPTAGPTPTPDTGPYPPFPEGCSAPLVNANFEQGPGVGWDERTPNGDPIIREFAEAVEGDYIAMFGRFPGRQEVLISESWRQLVPDAELESATLRFKVAILTDEVPNGQPDDLFGVGVLNETNDLDVALGISEESFAPNTWQQIADQDITEYFLERAGYPTGTLAWISESSASEVTNFLLDDVELEVCTTSGERFVLPLSAPQSGDAGSAAPLRVSPGSFARALLRDADLREGDGPGTPLSSEARTEAAAQGVGPATGR